MKLKHTLILALLVSCSSTPGDTNTDSDSIGGGFPFDGSGGKTDVFGRSLVGAPNQ